MKVKDIMTREVISVRTDMRVGQIARVFRQHQLSGLPVVDLDGELVGVITELDMVKRHARPQMPAFLPLLGAYLPLGTKDYKESLRRITGVTAEDIMTTPVNTIGPDASIEDAATVMVSNRSNPLPVVDAAGRMVGIVSRTDILRVIEEMELHLEEEAAPETTS
ncbi:MAG TPA: CBS domain-containing protein [Anaerolineae bacterium]|nr:CBS domain-containing protein [Anaerolineae bacterium]HNU05773.1 CBS domain-containing protein [Anaerolineae bacterium]